jgi:hypothetical protein
VYGEPQAPTISWATPAPITYGTPLGGVQLDASSSVAGTFAYTPAAGTVLGAGAHTLDATFTPADGEDYTSAGASVTITVLKAPTRLAAVAPIDPVHAAAIGAIGARLTRGDTGAPLAGETITFTSRATPLCSLPTGSSGIASCRPSLANAIRVLLGLGYTARFAGTGDYLPSTATAWLVGLP